MKEVLEEIERISDSSKTTSQQVVLYLMEEVGELAEALREDEEQQTYLSGQAVQLEAVDCILCCLDLLYKQGASTESIEEYMLEKSKKWEEKHVMKEWMRWKS